jgi:hypothetical protein
MQQAVHLMRRIIKQRISRSMVHALAGAVILALISTFGDFVWEALSLRHRLLYGVAHGAATCLAVGAVIGWRGRRPLLGAAAGMLIGIAAAGVFYVLAPVMRYRAMFPAWMFFWLCFAMLQAQFEAFRGYREAALRGVIAAALSGLAFYAISGIWTRPSPGGPDYVRNFLSWAVAFFPGFAALFVGSAFIAERKQEKG